MAAEFRILVSVLACVVLIGCAGQLYLTDEERREAFGDVSPATAMALETALVQSGSGRPSELRAAIGTLDRHLREDRLTSLERSQLLGLRGSLKLSLPDERGFAGAVRDMRAAHSATEGEATYGRVLTFNDLVSTLLITKRFDEAITELEKDPVLAGMIPGGAASLKGRVYIEQDDYGALQALLDGLPPGGFASEQIELLRYAAALSSKRWQEAEASLDRLDRKAVFTVPLRTARRDLSAARTNDAPAESRRRAAERFLSLADLALENAALRYVPPAEEPPRCLDFETDAVRQVNVTFSIDERGTTENVDASDAHGACLEMYVEEVVRGYRYRPLFIDGRATSRPNEELVFHYAP